MTVRQIVQTDEGLELIVEGGSVALIRLRHGTLDLVWRVHGPQTLDRARQVIPGLIDLLIEYDRLQAEPKKLKKIRGRGLDAEEVDE